MTTGSAEGQTVKLGGKTLTFHFPTAETPPKLKTQGNAAVVGRQRVALEDGNLVFQVAGK